VIDPVSDELERRAVVSWPWRSALLAALIVHVVTAGTVVLASRTHRRPLLLPSVQVRLGVVPPAPAGPPAAASGPSRAAGPARAAARPPARATAAAPPASRRIAPKTAVPTAPAELPADGAAAEGGRPAAGPQPGTVASGAAGLAAESGDGAGDEPFPYDYYLQRLLGAIEANWFRPPAPEGTRCRVLCRIDRGGRLVESGIESPSAVPAFDRAALRAVYAAAPFPPLPQGFGRATLTLHLDFGP